MDKKDKSSVPHLMSFSGSSPEDVEHAKSFWRSLNLHPPLESRLVSADIRQRLKVATVRPKNDELAVECLASENERFMKQAHELEKADERIKYRALAQQREQVLNLLYRQRAQRMAKEMISRNHR
uniref:UPF0722 protein C11orf88 homolog n=1 Tax=Ciona intestinalis TaxID=7719 RepID=UPI000180C623|nr:UPF0722 protein C11orf88 homolog [Ciona intestinalis]|eukprot:XP_004227381.1 UPF0722 protein C11orf88 homolog [Ciona intestinalis]